MNILEKYNNPQWQHILENEDVEQVCSQVYDYHKTVFTDDATIVKNLTAPDIDISLNSFEAYNFFPTTNGEYQRTYTPLAAEQSKLSQKRFPQDSAIVNYVKQSLNLKQAIVHCNLQFVGDIVAVHIDYNRNLYKTFPKETSKLLSKDLKKYIWFLEDQQVGQMFAVGRNNLNWQAGDIVSFPWYMPHATANSSNYHRKILFISGF